MSAVRMPAAAPAAPRRWLVCADDFAIDAGAVEGILDLIGRGCVTATSALVDSPLWPESARALSVLLGKGAARRADVGLHLNFTQAFASRGNPAWPLAELMLRSALHAIPRPAVHDAIAQQLDAFEEHMGRRPDYVDGHQHVHQFSGVREELVGALLRRYPGDLPWLRVTRPPAKVREPKARLIAALGDAALRSRAAAAGLRSSAYLVGVYGFDEDEAGYLARLERWIDAGPDGSVLMCHPANRADASDPISAARTVEYRVLASAAFSDTLRRGAITLVTGRDLPAHGN